MSSWLPRSWATYRLEWVTGSYAALYLSLLLAGTGHPSIVAVTTWMFFAFGPLTIMAQLELARDTRLDDRTRRAWRWLTASSACIVAGGVLWTFLPGAVQRTPGWLAWLQTAHAPLAAIGFFTFPGHREFTLRDPRLRLDAILLAVGAGALSWFFTLQPLLNGAHAGNTAGSFVTFALDWVAVLAAAIAYLRSGCAATRSAISLLLAAHVLYILSDFVWLLWEDTYAPGHWLDAMWFTAWAVRWSAARVAAHHDVERDREPAEQSAYRSGIAPSLFVAGAYTLLVVSVFRGSAEDAVAIGVVASVMTALLLARQGLELKENRRLALVTQAQTARYRSLLAHATDFVMVIDTDRTVAYASPSVTSAGLATTGATCASLMHPTDADALDRWLSRGRETMGAPLQCRMRARDGQWRDMELRGQDLRADPHVRGYVVNGRDISDEVALESRLRQAHKLAALHDLAGRIAHAYNNSLASIQGHAELIALEASQAGASTEEADAIRSAAERGAGITRQLLGFSGRHVIQPVLLEPAAVLGDLMPTFLKLLPDGIDLHVDTAARGGLVMFDRAQLEQVLVNLVANARDAMPDGGSVSVSTRVTGTAGSPGSGRVILEVTDTGIGIPAEMRHRIFEPFFTTKGPGRGTGLGLAMVQTIVTRAQGTIEVVSAPGRGTTFRISLPQEEPRARVPTPATPLRIATPGSGTVLLVDDEPAVLRASSRMLQRAGFEVIECSSGAAAVEIVHSTRGIDVLVTDYMMRQVSGRDVIEAFRRLRPGVPIVCMTGFAAEADDASPLALDVHSIVAKPFSSAALVGAVSGALATAATALRAASDTL